MHLTLRSFQPAGARLPAGAAGGQKNICENRKAARPSGETVKNPPNRFWRFGGGICCGRKTGTVKYRAVLNAWKKKPFQGLLISCAKRASRT